MVGTAEHITQAGGGNCGGGAGREQGGGSDESFEAQLGVMQIEAYLEGQAAARRADSPQTVQALGRGIIRREVAGTGPVRLVPPTALGRLAVIKPDFKIT